MRIAQVAPMYESVPPHRYGGTERVVSYLTEELVRRGHHVTLFASGDSRTSAHLVPTSEQSLRERFTNEEMRELGLPLHLAMFGEIVQRADEFDILHCHIDYLPFAFQQFVHTPIVTTMHGRLDLPVLPPFFTKFSQSAVVSISYNQRTPLAALRPHWVGTVYNGIPVHDFPFSAQGGDYLLFLGRIALEKRVDWAVEIAKRTGIKLKIAAKIDPTDRAFYEREIAHLFEHPLVEFVGEVDEQEKRELLAGAYGLVFPIDWPEPFGIVQIEALACGTPVLAMNRGSVPEVLRHGVTALIGNTVDELVELAPKLGGLDRRVCRREAQRRFSDQVMADGYEQVYKRVIAERQSDELGLALAVGNGRMPITA